MSRIRKKKIDRGPSQSGSLMSSSSGMKKQKTVDLGWKADENIDSDDDGDDDNQYQMGQAMDDESVEEEEALDAKRVRLARQYLETMEGGSDDSSSAEGSSDDDGDDDGLDDDGGNVDRIGIRLQRERLKREGVLEREVADKVSTGLDKIRKSFSTSKNLLEKEWIDSGHIKLMRGHDLTPTCVALQSDGRTAISGSKDHSVLIWDVEKETKAHTLCPNWRKNHNSGGGVIARTRGEVLSVACSDDGRYAAIGKRDGTVSIFDIRTGGKNSLVKTFEGHKAAVTCLCFRTQSLQLFSGSEDRCIRHYNLSEMMYLETLYGHQFGVTDIDCHRKERPISVGRDRTARAWKIAEDSHLIFRGGAKVSSPDCVGVIKDDWYVTGHDDGHLGLWMTEKKRAFKMIEHAHGSEGGVGRGICSIGTLKGSDLVVTGSYDNYLRLWKARTGATLDTRSFESVDTIPLEGYINGIAVGPKARFCVVAVGQEPALGRWNRIPNAKNRFGIISLRDRSEASNDDDDEDDNDDAALEESTPSESGSDDSEDDSSTSS